MPPVDSILECCNCEKLTKGECFESCDTQTSTYWKGITTLADNLYTLRCNVIHEGNMYNEHYLVDTANSDALIPRQIQSFTNKRWVYGKPVINLGALINTLYLDSINYYNLVSDEKKTSLNNFDKDVVCSNDIMDVSM